MDNRNIRTGRVIAEDGYSDQPYIVRTDDGHWLLTVTTAGTHEGAAGQHVISMRSADCGKSWSEPVPVAPELPESSYSVLYKTDYGRIYCFYNFNADNLRGVIGDNPPFGDGICRRVDTQGHFVFRYSDDHGKSWSARWYDIPMRTFEVDRLNPYGGEIKYFWNVGKPLPLDGAVLVPIYKIRAFGVDFMRYSEGALLRCGNINTERDPEKLVWETLPDGDIGIRAPHALTIVSEEHSFVPLSDGSVFCVFRTTTGHPWCAYSRDGCHSFTAPEPLTFADGRPVKHPRAANFIWKCENGKYLYWFHNHGGRSFDGRNPAWLSGAVEYMAEDGIRLRFGEPQPVLYDPDPAVRMSYPDMVEEGGEYYITETQKEIARVHPIDRTLIESLWESPQEGEGWQHVTDDMPGELLQLGGRSVSLRFTVMPGDAGALFSTMEGGRGLSIRREADGSLLMLAGDGERMCAFVNDDPALADGRAHTVTAVFDGGACAVYFVTDGRFSDGGDRRAYGFTRFDLAFGCIAGAKTPAMRGIEALRIRAGVHLYD